MSKTAIYIVGGVAVAGGLYLLTRPRTQAPAPGPARRVIGSDAAGAAAVTVGTRAISLIDKWLSSRQQQQSAIDYGSLSSTPGSLFPNGAGDSTNGQGAFDIGTG